ncbi:MAG: zinc ABC transporter substrate-binding protein [Gammaproteobacteria bacterium]
MIKTVFTLALLLASQGASAALNVFTCEPEWAALAKAIGGDLLKIDSATTSLQDPHHVQARPSLIAKARNADLLVCTGAELEIGWLPVLLNKSGNSELQAGQPAYFMASDFVDMLNKPEVLDRSLGDIHADGNPHVHLDPRNLLKLANALAGRLATLDAANKSAYENGLKDFTQRWQTAMTKWQTKAAKLRGKRLVVHHDSWVYLVHWLGMKQVATLETKPGVPPGSAHLEALLEQMQRAPADMIVYAGYQDDRAAHWLHDKTGIRVVELPFSPAENEDLFHWFDTVVSRLQAAVQ